MQKATAKTKSNGSSIFNDAKIRGRIYQIVLVAFLCYLLGSLIINTQANIESQNIPVGFNFLWTTAGFGIIQKLVDYSEVSSYGRAIFVGFLNTLYVAGIGIILATILGFIIGIARLSNNFIISSLARIYVEVIRNIPLLLQILFWYYAVIASFPNARTEAPLSLFDLFHTNQTGLYMPAPTTGDNAYIVLIAFLIGVFASIFFAGWAKRKQKETGQQFPVFWITLGFIIILPVLAQIFAGFPIGIEYPIFQDTGPALRRGFQKGVGLVLLPEFLALLLSLVIYTAAFIGEIVRAGIMAVSKGQTEAAHALGIRQGPTLRLVIIPQALRVIIPPLTSQYLNLTKNSSLAVAIAYPDLVAVGGTVLNQTGQAIEIVALWMMIYLSLSLLTSAFMNWYNRRMALVER